MFITVLHGDNQRSLFNTQCKTVVLLDWIKVKCGCRREAEIDLANLNGQMMNLPHHQSAVASDVLGQREEYILVSMSRTGDPSNPVYTPLLHNYHLPDPQCLVKLPEAKTEQETCASAEEGRLNRTLTSSVSNESQPKPHKQIRFSSASTFQVYPV
ncbi:hypothetical protein KOW79_014946 [Hemibagrus wyckioides]|uniref:Uncharacterized protein n=1 Tax=Hemibagrus wyckioides TaxID=337641 RepID=A0A9D3NFQ2_9TELE|nr:uncharacterized protein CXorf65-like isoform X1 [Hemibagrus wyckioides]KAG7322088.1 hypothetical protein KOW79_014946 [Hemibagrus wyckioides]